jgi:hypothetical protein
MAARGGHLDVLRWAWANGCPWDAGTSMMAARGGEQHTRGSGGSLDPPGPLPMHLHTVCVHPITMCDECAECAECLP